MDGARRPDSGRAAAEILSSSSCAHAGELRARLETFAEEEGVAITITGTLIETLEQAQERRFPGSPTVRVEGRDVEPGAEALERFGLG